MNQTVQSFYINKPITTLQYIQPIKTQHTIRPIEIYVQQVKCYFFKALLFNSDITVIYKNKTLT